MTQTVILCVNCADSAGLFGIHLDQRVSEALGVHCAYAVTEVVASRTGAPSRRHPVPPRLVEAQMDAVALQMKPRACKIGLLATGALAEAVAGRLRRRSLSPVVLGPALPLRNSAHPAGGRLCRAVQRILELSHAAVLQAHDAGALVGPNSQCLSLAEAAQALSQAGPACVLVVEDAGPQHARFALRTPGNERVQEWLSAVTLSARALCDALSTAVAAHLALGDPVHQAMAGALRLMACDPTGYNRSEAPELTSPAPDDDLQRAPRAEAGLSVRAAVDARAGDE